MRQHLVTEGEVLFDYRTELRNFNNEVLVNGLVGELAHVINILTCQVATIEFASVARHP